ncbi:MAG: dehydrogenase, partial [Chitinophagia bacterium]|nr:dehydrogenase [Chitinophagia bacterium]
METKSTHFPTNPIMKENNDSANASRRDFVRQGTLLAGGMVAAPLLSRANYFSGADDVIRIALVGCGGRGTGAAMQALSTQQNVRLVAMADAFRDRLEDCLKAITSDENAEKGRNIKARVDVPEERRFTGFDAYLKAIPLADVVILATPPGFRPLHFEEAVKQG